ncbi:CU044_5270 family protein [Streptomyces iakyrus]|uniref:CU044_5270 family protein n=1 Tax=Streptomyces iakyrus TaxID=68219 RepID=UPI0033BC8E47
MNELFACRRLRAGAPFPDAGRLAGPRARLTAALGQETRRGRAALPVRRMVLAGAAAATLAVTGGVVATLPQDSPHASAGQGPARAVGRRFRRGPRTGRCDGREARRHRTGPQAVAVRREHRLRPGQAANQRGVDPLGRHRARQSARHSPPAGDVSDFDPDKLQVWYGPIQEDRWKKEGYDDRSQRQFYRFLATVPSDPDRMMRRIREEHAIGSITGETRAQRDWREIDVLYRSVLIRPNVQAGLFRALAKIPGARVTTGVKDPLGRTAIGVSVTYAEKTPTGWQGRQEIFFDPESYAYLGQARDDGEIVSARAAWGVVSRPGARP